MMKKKMDRSAKCMIWLERPHIEKETGIDSPEAI